MAACAYAGIMKDGKANPDFDLTLDSIIDKLPILDACIMVGGCSAGSAGCGLPQCCLWHGSWSCGSALAARHAARHELGMVAQPVCVRLLLNQQCAARAACMHCGSHALCYCWLLRSLSACRSTVVAALLQETLRLQPALSIGTVRAAEEDMTLGDLKVDKGTEVGGGRGLCAAE